MDHDTDSQGLGSAVGDEVSPEDSPRNGTKRQSLGGVREEPEDDPEVRISELSTIDYYFTILNRYFFIAILILIFR